MSAIDTPDYQRGFVSAQKLLASVPSGDNSTFVAIPPNAETLVVVSVNAMSPDTPALCRGTFTDTYYAGWPAWSNNPAQINTWFFDVSNAVDVEVVVGIFPITPGPWFIYADANAHTVVDMGRRINGNGSQYVCAVPPSTLENDHPPTELQFSSNELSANGTAFGAPGAGVRYRLFGAWLASISGTGSGFLTDAASGVTILSCAAGTNMAQTFPPSGLPLGDGGAIDWVQGGSGSVVMGIHFTEDTV